MKNTIATTLLVFGTDTGVTEEISNLIYEKWTKTTIKLIEVSDVSKQDFEQYDFYIFGLSTWYDGDLQSDWESYLDEFKTINFNDKSVAIFGLGDQIGYGEYFIDGVGILAKIVLANGGKLLGKWPIGGYEFSASKAQINDRYFYGLAIDEDTQSSQTNDRLDQWILQLEKEL